MSLLEENFISRIITDPAFYLLTSRRDIKHKKKFFEMTACRLHILNFISRKGENVSFLHRMHTASEPLPPAADQKEIRDICKANSSPPSTVGIIKSLGFCTTPLYHVSYGPNYNLYLGCLTQVTKALCTSHVIVCPDRILSEASLFL